MTYLPDAQADSSIDDASLELSANRTSLSFERTHMSADRTLMSQVRTSLSMIGFGFTIHEVFRRMAANGILEQGDLTARRLGATLLTLGVFLLAMGIVGYVQFSHRLTSRRAFLTKNGLLHQSVNYNASPTFITAALLLLAGLGALASIALQMM